MCIMMDGPESVRTVGAMDDEQQLYLDELIPSTGDAVTIVNRGSGRFEIIAVTRGIPAMELTEEDVRLLRSGEASIN